MKQDTAALSVVRGRLTRLVSIVTNRRVGMIMLVRSRQLWSLCASLGASVDWHRPLE